jgi:hypothetical protein
MAKTEFLGLQIDYSRDNLFDKLGLARLKESYMKEDETSPQERFAFVSKMFASNNEHAQRLYDYSSKHWLSYSTPILSLVVQRGMPISCFLNYINDTAEGLVENLSETNWFLCLGVALGLVLVSVPLMISLLVLCLISRLTMHRASHIAKVALDGALTLLILTFLTLIL